ncbi:helix-turn-helix domain-containing protein [Clostridium sp. YIM B02551]|uniref:helix-turn-helix domain-containing protein n=1 Tax=Clostridium sp. YIM B02551 TaxID=2910679 RepID=UPI001EEA5683|nr:helix-turn-helix transcriptional regulator [Clostridium sp. YIM B02551]
MNTSIGENIKRLRTEKGLTQKELAEKCNISLSALNKYERGERVPKIENISSIASALGVNSHEIVKSREFLNESGQMYFISLSKDEEEMVKELCTNKTLYMLKFLDMDDFNLSILSIEDIRNLQKKMIQTAVDFYRTLDKDNEQ